MGNKNNKDSKEEYDIEFVGEIEKSKKSYLIKRIKYGETSNIKIISSIDENKIIIKKKNHQTLFNLIDVNCNIENHIFKSDCIILEYDINDINSLNNIKTIWDDKIKKNKKANLIYLIGIKIDKNKEKDDTSKEAMHFAELNNIKFLSISDNDINKFIDDFIYSIEKEMNTLKTKKIEIKKNPEKIIKKKAYKILFVGDSGIGAKTSLINEIMFKGSKLELNESFMTSSRFVKNIYLKNGEEIRLILEDTAGQERFRSITEKNFNKSDCIVIGFDVTSRKTFESVVGYWKSAIEEYNCLKYLIGNKIDLYDNRQVTNEEIMKFAEDNKLRCFLISCLTGEGVQNFFDDLVNEITKKRELMYK